MVLTVAHGVCSVGRVSVGEGAGDGGRVRADSGERAGLCSLCYLCEERRTCEGQVSQVILQPQRTPSPTQ